MAELREIYRPSQGAQPEPVALDRLLEEVHNLVSPHLASNNVNWHLVMEPQRPGERWEVAGSADQFKQVFLNLSMNAIEAMQGQGGDLSVMLRRDPSGGRPFRAGKQSTGQHRRRAQRRHTHNPDPQRRTRTRQRG